MRKVPVEHYRYFDSNVDEEKVRAFIEQPKKKIVIKKVKSVQTSEL